MKSGTLSGVLALFHAFSFAAAWGNCTVSYPGEKKTCTVYANGNEQDDVPNIMKAFTLCNNSGTVVFPQSQTYWIATKLNPVLNDVTVEWYGEWLYSDDLTYWRENSYPITFQNVSHLYSSCAPSSRSKHHRPPPLLLYALTYPQHHAGFIVSGQNIRIYGYGTGGINGNGNAWYNVEQNFTQPGRPMPFVWVSS